MEELDRLSNLDTYTPFTITHENQFEFRLRLVRLDSSFNKLMRKVL